MVERQKTDKEIRWQEAGERYAAFFSSLSDDERRELLQPEGSKCPHNPGNIQLLFLGEKPAVFENVSYSSGLAEKFGRYGYRIMRGYVYSPENLKEILKRSPDLFSAYTTRDPNIFMEEFSKQPITEQHHLRGLLLGYPQRAVERFTDPQRGDFETFVYALIQKLASTEDGMQILQKYRPSPSAPPEKYWGFLLGRDILKENSQANQGDEERIRLLACAESICRERVFGLPYLADEWVDEPDSTESKDQEERWKRAIQVSGVLKVYSPEQWLMDDHISEHIRREVMQLLTEIV